MERQPAHRLMPEGKGRYYINPYVGCMIASPFCYVIDRADFSRHLEALPSLPPALIETMAVAGCAPLR